MVRSFKFSNWNQLSGLKSTSYPNLRIKVTQFKSEQLTGTKIDIIDVDNCITYFSGFIRVINSNRFNPLAVFDVADIIKRINSYGFNIEIVEPITLPPNVITMLKGLQALGYAYLTIEYKQDTVTDDKSLYQGNIDNPRTSNPFYELCQTVVHCNKYIVATKYLGDIPNKPVNIYNKVHDSNIYIVSESPDFSWEDFKWMEPTRVYSIESILPTSSEEGN